MRKLVLGVGILVATLCGAFLTLRVPDTDPAEMLAKYGGAQAKFAAGSDGLRIHYRDQGNPAGPTLILLHGNSASLHTWEPVVRLLEKDFRLISYDHPGHGLTGPSKSEDYSAAGMMAALDVVARAAGVERFVLVGHSMGGWIAWRYALAHPDRVQGLILIDAAGAPLREGESPPPLNLGFKLLRIRWLRPVISSIAPRAVIAKSLRQTLVDASLVTDAMVDRYWELLRYPGNRRAAALRTDVDREPAMFDRISEITVPTLILWGQQDALIHATAARTFQERLPQAKAIVYDRVGHVPMEELPEPTAADIRAFSFGWSPQ